VQVDAFAIRLRPRRPWEAADLGIRLCQREARSVFRCYWAVAIPFAALCMATYEIASWLPALALWWGKPWLDRTILFVLARAGFGQSTSFADLWRAQRTVWWGQLLHTLTLRRLSPRRSFTQPVYQLEGLPFGSRAARLRLLRSRGGGVAIGVTGAFSLMESCMAFALLSLGYWMLPPGMEVDWAAFLQGEGSVWASLGTAAAYAVVLILLEPFYVAAGFGLYLNRRVELEAWDIEQEFRRAFAQ
jgi:hypothetical protein